MNKLQKEELKKVKGGNASATMINAVIRTVSTMFSIGQAIGSAIRRAVRGSYC